MIETLKINSKIQKQKSFKVKHTSNLGIFRYTQSPMGFTLLSNQPPFFQSSPTIIGWISFFLGNIPVPTEWRLIAPGWCSSHCSQHATVLACRQSSLQPHFPQHLSLYTRQPLFLGYYSLSLKCPSSFSTWKSTHSCRLNSNASVQPSQALNWLDFTAQHFCYTSNRTFFKFLKQNNVCQMD